MEHSSCTAVSGLIARHRRSAGTSVMKMGWTAAEANKFLQKKKPNVDPSRHFPAQIDRNFGRVSDITDQMAEFHKFLEIRKASLLPPGVDSKREDD